MTSRQLALGLLVAAAGCGGPPDETISVCIRSHTAQRLMVIGKTVMPVMRRVCDEWETQPNPRYAKWLEEQEKQ